MSVAADFVLSALGTKDFEDEDEYLTALTGAMILIDGLLDLARIKKILLEVHKK